MAFLIEQHSKEQSLHYEYLLQAISNEHNNALNTLLNKELSYDCVDSEGNSLLMQAARMGNNEACCMLLTKGGDLEKVSYDGYSALFYATIYHHLDICKQLILAGANVNMQNSDGITALMYAMAVNNVDIVKLLLSNGADANIVDNNMQWPSDFLMGAMTSKSHQCKELVKKIETKVKYFSLIFKKFQRYMAGTSNSFIESKDLTASLNFRLHEWKLYIKEFFLIIFYLGYVTIFIRHLINSVLMLFTTKKVHLHEIDDVSFKDSDITFVKSILKISNALPTKNTIIESDVISRKGSIATQWAFTVIISLALLIGHDLRSPSWGLMPFNLLDNVYMHEPLICILIAVATFFVVTYIDILRKKTLLMLVTKRLYREQENRDKKAADIVESINSDDGDLDLTFAVYLRPFESTGKLKSKKTGIEIETALGLVFPDYLPIISLGEPGEHIGTSRIKTDEEKWKTMVATMLLKTKLIILLPSSNKGTLWEINHIVEHDYLKKTIFLMLPQGDDNSATEWNELISQLKSLGLHLPRYQSNGLIFDLNTYGEVKQNRPFDSPPRYEDPLVLQEHDEAQRKLESEMRSVDMN